MEQIAKIQKALNQLQNIVSTTEKKGKEKYYVIELYYKHTGIRDHWFDSFDDLLSFLEDEDYDISKVQTDQDLAKIHHQGLQKLDSESGWGIVYLMKIDPSQIISGGDYDRS